MANQEKRLGDAEFEIMQVIWDGGEPLTSNCILENLKGQRNWQLSTLMTSLSRLCDKGFVKCDRSLGVNLYTPIVSENDYKSNAGEGFLKRIYNSSIRNMVATLYSSNVLSDNDVAELRQYLDELEAKGK